MIQTIFIKTLGIEYNGLDGLFTSILTILNLFELGIGSSITFNLYRYIKNDDKESINLGDKVSIADNNFYVIANPDDGKVKLLPEYNINGFDKQSSSFSNGDKVSFADFDYWTGSSDFLSFGSSTYKYVYRNVFNISSTDGDTNNNLKVRINAYKDYLNSFDLINVSDPRLMSYEESVATGCSNNKNSCPNFVSNQPYWLGSTGNYFWAVHIDSNRIRNGWVDYNNQTTYGIRPLIIVNESDLPTNFD